MSVRDEIAKGAARAFFLTAYADFMERDFDADEASHVTRAEFDEERAGLPRAGSGQNWNDHAPPTSPAAWEMGWSLVKTIERETGKTIDVLFNGATILCSRPGGKISTAFRCKDNHTPDLYGHYLAMEAMGHGVTWADDHEDHPFEVPSHGSEFMIVSRDEATAGIEE
jgi:hypothetical protein